MCPKVDSRMADLRLYSVLTNIVSSWLLVPLSCFFNMISRNHSEAVFFDNEIFLNITKWRLRHFRTEIQIPNIHVWTKLVLFYEWVGSFLECSPIDCYQKLDHWTMQFKSFHWLSYRTLQKINHVLQIWQAYADLFPYLEIIFPLAHAGYEMVWAWIVPVLSRGRERTLGTTLRLNISPQSCVSGHVVRAVLGYAIEINWPRRPGYLSLRMGRYCFFKSIRYRVRYWLFSSIVIPILWRHWVNW